MAGELFILFIILLFIFIILWFALRNKKPQTWKDAEIELREEFHEKEKQYLEQIQELKLEYKQDLNELSAENKEELNELAKQQAKQEKGFRQDAVKRSRNTLMGKLWETVAPYLPKFKYHPADMRFIGSPIDYIIFKGMSKKNIEGVVFLEIKSGDSKLNEQEEKLKRAVKAGRVRWEEFRIK